MKLNRPALAIAATAATVALAPAAAHAYTADDRYDSYGTTDTRVVASVDYLSSSAVDVSFGYVKDKAGDPYCTVLEAELWGTYGGYHQLGSTIRIGSVCNGAAASFPIKRITTGAAGGIYEVRLQARKGVGGSWAAFGVCRAATDGSENCR